MRPGPGPATQVGGPGDSGSGRQAARPEAASVVMGGAGGRCSSQPGGRRGPSPQGLGVGGAWPGLRVATGWGGCQGPGRASRWRQSEVSPGGPGRHRKRPLSLGALDHVTDRDSIQHTLVTSCRNSWTGKGRRAGTAAREGPAEPGEPRRLATGSGPGRPESDARKARQGQEHGRLRGRGLCDGRVTLLPGGRCREGAGAPPRPGEARVPGVPASTLQQGTVPWLGGGTNRHVQRGS